MKQILFSILSFILCFLFSGCADIPTSAGASDISSMIAYEIENLEGAENFDEETIKTLGKLMHSNYLNNKNIFNTKNKHTNNNIYNIVKSIETDDLTQYKQTFVFDGKNEWSKEISKGSILMFLADKKISIATMSDIKPIYKDKNISGLSLGGKFISAEEIVSRFDLPSANVYNIEDKKTKILVSGVIDENAVDINPKKLVEMSKTGKKSDEILKTLKNDFYLITKNK